MKGNKLKKVGRIVIAGGSVLLTLGLAAGSMLEANSGQVNNYLNTSTTRITGGGEYDSFTPDEEYLNEDGSANTSALVEAHIDLGTKVQEEGSVLLKNKDGALPLTSTSPNVTVFGYRSTDADAIYGMTIGSPEEDSQNVSLHTALVESGFNVNETVYNAYESLSGASDEHSINDVISAAGTDAYNTSITNYSDAAIIVLGRTSHESTDKTFTSTGNGDLVLTTNELALVNYVTNLNSFDKVIVLVSATNALELEDIENNENVDSILWIGSVGNYGFYGVANILLGNANPSGRLVDTFAVDSGSAPSMTNFGNYIYSGTNTDLINSLDIGSTYVVQSEGIYVGYKYYETRYEDSVLGEGNARSNTGQSGYSQASNWNYENEVTYPFGYGLSYTSFTQTLGNVTFSSDGKTATVEVTVSNTGTRAGKDVVQVYAQSPYTTYDKNNNVEKASVQLLGYEKTDTIEPNSSDTVEVTLDLQYLASYDSSGEGTYIMETDGTYYFALGKNDDEVGAHAAINNILAKKGYSSSGNTYMTNDGNESLVYDFTWSYDTDLFATSKSGTKIENQLEDFDYNYYNENSITYLSRNNWQTTWPRTYSGLEITTDMVKYLQNDYYEPTGETVSVDTEFGQDGEYTFPDMFGADYDDERWEDVINQIELISAVSFTATGNRTFYEMDEIKFLSANSYTENGSVGIQKALGAQSDEYAPWYVTSDDEYYSYQANTFCSSVVQASTWNKELIEEIGVLWGNDALFINIPMVWAPGINLHRAPYNGRNGDYYSEDPLITGYSALNLAKGAISKGLITTVKHLAINQQETNRIGVSTYITEQAAREGELRSFQIALEGEEDENGNTVGVLGIMTAYNRVGCTYAGGHEGMMQGVVRDEWGYKGYITSDLLTSASTYMPYEESMIAGQTNFDLTSSGQTIWYDDDYSTRRTLSSIAEDIQDDDVLLAHIKENLHYSLYSFAQTNLANWMTSTTETVWAWNWWRVTYVGIEVVGGVLAGLGLISYCIAFVMTRDKKQKKNIATDKKGGKK